MKQYCKYYRDFKMNRNNKTQTDGIFWYILASNFGLQFLCFVFGRIRLLNVYSLVQSLKFVSQSLLSSSSMGRFTPGMYFNNLRLKLFCLGLR